MKKRFVIAVMTCMLAVSTAGCERVEKTHAGSGAGDEILLRVCNWEEYIDYGGWDEEEAIELDNGTTIIGKNSMVEDFENWYYKTTGKHVRVEYSCAGTNEDLYNQLTLGDVYDVICPSDYMIMKLMDENMLEPFSEEFFDENAEYNYYAKGVSPYIRQVFEENEIGGKSWSKYSACYMWGVTGNLYNPAYVSSQDVNTMGLYANKKYKGKVTLKDNVRDSYFVALGLLNSGTLTAESFLSQSDYQDKLAELMNANDEKTIEQAEKILGNMVKNAYSLETDSGKADMITGKVVASYQWSGDAVYAMDQAEEEGSYLNFAIPEECTNLWFDGWVMLKPGIDGNQERKQAAEAFVNFMSRPDNVVRNMYYIGYTSAISGGEDDTIYEYVKWCYGDEEGDGVYDLSYFFSDHEENKYKLIIDSRQADRQLGAQYPKQEVMAKSAVMGYFDKDANKRINQMWINVRCFEWRPVHTLLWVAVLACIVIGYLKKKAR